MDFLKKNKTLLTNVSLIIVILSLVIYVKTIFSESHKNFNEIQSYSEGLLGDDSSISFSDIIWDNYELFINWELIHKWNTLNSFNEKLTQIIEDNSQLKIYVNIFNDDELIKTDIFRYSDFWYTLNKKGILTKIRAWIISSKWKTEINLKDYLFFDNKLLNQKIDTLKERYTESSNWEIYYSKDKQLFKVNSNKVFLSSVKDIKLNIVKVDSNLILRDSAIDIYMETKENVFFEQVKELNNILDIIKNKELVIKNSLEWINYWNVSKLFNDFNIETINISKGTSDFNMSLSKWFITDHIKYNSDFNRIELDEDSFDQMYGQLWSIRIKNKDDVIKEKPSLYSIQQGGLTENKPTNNQFKILSYWNWITFDYVWLKKELKLYINKIFNNSDDEETVISTNNLFVKNIEKINKQISVVMFDSTLISKDDYNLDSWVYYKWDYITERYINYSNYPFNMNMEDSWHNTCYIENNINLHCEEEEILVWKLGYNWESIIIKEPDEKLYSLSEEEYWLTKKSWNLVLNKSRVSIYLGWLYNSVEFMNQQKQIISDYKKEIFPKFMWDYIEWKIVFDKVVFSFIWDANANSMLIKTNESLDNNYLYFFNVKIKTNEE